MNTMIKFEKKSVDWRNVSWEEFTDIYEDIFVLCKVGRTGRKIHKGYMMRNKKTKELHKFYPINSCANNFIRATAIIKIIESAEDEKQINCARCNPILEVN